MNYHFLKFLLLLFFFVFIIFYGAVWLDKKACEQRGRYYLPTTYDFPLGCIYLDKGINQ